MSQIFTSMCHLVNSCRAGLPVVEPSQVFLHGAHRSSKCNRCCDPKVPVSILTLTVILNSFGWFSWLCFNLHCLSDQPGVVFSLASTSGEAGYSLMNPVLFNSSVTFILLSFSSISFLKKKKSPV